VKFKREARWIADGVTEWRAHGLRICIAGGLVYVGCYVYERLIS
jgi:hypothetical protein